MTAELDLVQIFADWRVKKNIYLTHAQKETTEAFLRSPFAYQFAAAASGKSFMFALLERFFKELT